MPDPEKGDPMIPSLDPAAAKRNVLIVDDEERLSRFVSICLNRVGYHTTTCRSVDEARELLPTERWSLVMTDLVMPDETGFDLLRWIGENCPEVPVIVLTAHSTPAVVKQVAQARAAALLKKPFSLEELYKTVSDTLAA
ncbi:MAG: response regulator [Chloroflexi bacterium]|nr:MAG: response regulator [Chloroflexota bacterium]